MPTIWCWGSSAARMRSCSCRILGSDLQNSRGEVDRPVVKDQLVGRLDRRAPDDRNAAGTERMARSSSPATARRRRLASGAPSRNTRRLRRWQPRSAPAAGAVGGVVGQHGAAGLACWPRCGEVGVAFPGGDKHGDGADHEYEPNGQATGGRDSSGDRPQNESTRDRGQVEQQPAPDRV